MWQVALNVELEFVMNWLWRWRCAPIYSSHRLDAKEFTITTVAIQRSGAGDALPARGGPGPTLSIFRLDSFSLLY